MTKKTLLTMMAAAMTLMASAAPTILSLKNTITDDAIVYPESFETDTHKMMQNWYLQNYTDLDKDADSKPDVNTSDEVYIERLSKMPTTIEMPFNQIVKSYIEMYTKRRRGLVENMLGMSLYYMPIFEQALEREGLPTELKYLPIIESALNPEATSRAGAAGLWQFMVSTAHGYGLEINSLIDERRDPIRSSDAAARLLKDLYKIYGDWSLAIAAYNCGPGNVNKALRRVGDTGGEKDFWAIYSYLPAETRGYVPCFIAANYAMTYYKEHNISPALARKPIITDSIHVNQRVHFNQIANVLNMPVDELRVLNPQYRRDVIPGDCKPYSLVLPSQQVYSYIMSEDSILAYDASRYARRKVVEPAQPISAVRGDYAKAETRYHKVRRGETIQSIASAYGVTVADIQRTNGISKVKRGQTLKIVIPQVEPQTPVDNIAANDSVNTATPPTQGDMAEAAQPATQSQPATQTVAQSRQQSVKPVPSQRQKAKDAKSKRSQSRSTTVQVKEGDNLYNIAKKNGTTVEQLKRDNHLKGDVLQPGQKLTVTKDSSSSSKGKSSKGSAKKSTSKKGGKKRR